MAKRPYISVGADRLNNYSKIYESNHEKHNCILHHNDSEQDLYFRLGSVVETILNSRSSTSDGVDCADGSCETVYVPIIVVHKYHSNIPSSITLSGISPQAMDIYTNVVTAIGKLNTLFSNNTDLSDEDIKDITGIIVPSNTPNSIDDVDLIYDVRTADLRTFGYYTGEQILDTDRTSPTSGQYIAEYVPFTSLQESKINIQFFFPTKIKTEYLLAGLFSEDYLNVNVLDMYEVLGDAAPAYLFEEYLTFHEEYPGRIDWDLNVFNLDFYNKLQQLQRITNGNTLSGLINRIVIGNAVDAVQSPELEGDTFIYAYGYSESTSKSILKNFSYLVNQSAFNSLNTLSASVNPYAGAIISTNIGYISATAFYHEFFHTIGAGHAFYDLTLARPDILSTHNVDANGEFTGDTFVGRGSLCAGFVTKNTISDYLGTHVNEALKPPFTYSIYNDTYALALRDVEKASKDIINIDDVIDQGGGYDPVTYQSHVDHYNQRKLNLQNKLNSTPEYITGNYAEEVEGGLWNSKEKGYVEFVINKLVPYYTQDFTRKLTFIPGSSQTENPVRAHININSQIPNGGDVQYMDRVFGKPSSVNSFEYLNTLQSLIVGLNSFWGGSYVIENAPEYNTEYTTSDGVTGIVGAPTGNAFVMPQEEYAERITGVQENNLPIGYVSVIDNRYINLIVTLENGSPEVVLVDLLADNSIKTKIVVNPADINGQRIGPNVTTYMPFCKINAQGEQTNFVDPFFIHNFNAYNPDFPPYPNNTPVENLTSDTFCPCLYESQTYYDGSELLLEYKVLGESANPWALHQIYSKNHCLRDKGPDGSANTMLDNSTIINKYGTFGNRISTAGYQYGGYIQGGGEMTSVDELADKAAAMWLFNLHNYENLNDDGGILKMHEYDDGSFLNLPYVIGYCGFNWTTTLPNSYQINRKTILEDYNGSGYYLKLKQGQENVPEDLRILPPMDKNVSIINHKRKLRLCLSGMSSSIFGSSVTQFPGGENIKSRYSLGSTDLDSPYYNPLAEHFEETAGYISHGGNASQGSIHLFDDDPKQEYYKDLYGEYNPLYMNELSVYEDVGANMESKFMDPDYIKFANIYFNSDAEIPTMYRQIWTDEQAYKENPVPLTSNSIEQFLSHFSSTVKGSNLDTWVGGCTDSGKFNYNPDANYDDGTCIDYVYGCNQEWALNYMFQGSDPNVFISDLSLGTPNSNINTDDGSCFTFLCTDPNASGDFAAGFNSTLFNQVFNYGGLESIIEGDPMLVGLDELDPNNNSLCQYTVTSIKPIVKLVCIDSRIPDNKGLEFCNNNEPISYYRNTATGQINGYIPREERELVQGTPLLDFIEIPSYLNTHSNPPPEGKVYLLTTVNDRIYNIQTENGDDFPSESSDGHLIESSDQYYDNTLLQALREVCGLQIVDNLNLQTNYKNQRRYNCVENPILPDGTGGCYLLSYANTTVTNKLQGCVAAPADYVTPQNCNNQEAFTGGYITDATFFSMYDEFIANSEGSCESLSTETGGKYIVGTSTLGQIVDGSSLSLTQDQQNYYPGSAEARRKYLNPKEYRYSRVSVPYFMNVSVLLFDGSGNSYTGYFIVVSLYGIEERKYYAFDIDTGVQLYELFYSKNFIPGLVLPSNAQEERAKKMRKVINKITNLTIFTDN